MNDLLITETEDKEPYIKKITDDNIINLTGESGSGKSYYAKQFENNSDYIVVDTDEIFSRFDTATGINKEIGTILRNKYDTIPSIIKEFDKCYIEILKYLEASQKIIVIDSAQLKNIQDLSILKGTVIIMRTSINKCYERCIDRWLANNISATNEEKEEYQNKKKKRFAWYHSMNEFLIKLDNYTREL